MPPADPGRLPPRAELGRPMAGLGGGPAMLPEEAKGSCGNTPELRLGAEGRGVSSPPPLTSRPLLEAPGVAPERGLLEITRGAGVPRRRGLGQTEALSAGRGLEREPRDALSAGRGGVVTIALGGGGGVGSSFDSLLLLLPAVLLSFDLSVSPKLWTSFTSANLTCFSVPVAEGSKASSFAAVSGSLRRRNSGRELRDSAKDAASREAERLVVLAPRS